MTFLRRHWYDIGGLFAIGVLLFLFTTRHLSDYEYIVWFNLFSLFLHQLEEYRIVGTFPGMVNRAMYNSDLPDRFPLNTNTSLCVNVYMGWTSYFFAALYAEKATWLGIATILVSLGNLIAHTTIFNIKGKTFYNAGLATSWLLFAPCIFFFVKTVYTDKLASTTDLFIGIILGIALNVIGIIKLIDWLADRNTPYVFEQRNLLRHDRQKNNS